MFKAKCSVSMMLFEGFEIELSRKSVKNLNLRIDRQGKIKISAPYRCSLSYIQSFLETRRTWLLEHCAAVNHRRDMMSLAFKTGEVHRFWGQAYVLRIEEHPVQRGVVLCDEYLSCFVKNSEDMVEKTRAIQDFYRQQMQAVLPDLIKKWEPILGVQVKGWTLKAMKTRWGSCHTITHHICLNLNLIHHSVACLEYVLLHEMVHLLEASHNRRFHQLMTHFMPDWKQHKRALHFGIPKL